MIALASILPTACQAVTTSPPPSLTPRLCAPSLRLTVFCELRDVLRLSDQELPGGPRPAPSAPLQPEAARLQAIAADFRRYHQVLRRRVAARLAADGLGSFQPDSIVLSYLDRYGEGLVGHPVARDAAGRAVALLGAVLSAGFLTLLCVPGMPGFMASASWIALAGWVVLGALFYFGRAREYAAIPGPELDRLILGGSGSSPRS